ncbi:HNH endonuclease, partial [Pseudomonas aeruginosa]|nr:HNH endonuclease [Pseudomonas aeruginosa]
GFTIASQGAGDDEVALFPDEGQTTMEFVEGAAMQVVVNRYERDRQARQAALRLHGCRCQVCGLDMASRYGEIGQGFIHIHHLIPLAGIKQDYRLNPETDLIPVCPNCHAMLHRR